MTRYTCNLKYFKGTVYLKFGRYDNGRIAIILMSADDHSTVAKVTVNFPYTPLEPDEIIVKNYGENEGVLEFLEANNLVDKVSRLADNGAVICPIVKLNKEILNQIPHQ